MSADVGAITLLTVQVALASTALAGVLGVPAGLWLGERRTRFRRTFLVLTRTLYGLPPVLAGLFVFLLLSRAGPLGSLGLLFTPEAMVVAQVLLLAPLLAGMVASAVASVDPLLGETARAVGASESQVRGMLLREIRRSLVGALMLAFGRAIGEVGAVIIVGGNIQSHTRVLTTAIVLETGRGDLQYAVLLGVILLALSAATVLALTLWEDRP
ncbi:MAG TPA: ABC transporter permease [Candidatus Thermoplasmatota archaeon]|nr:ABC transporter permease [Candidatus Thermoplasmatota archaeon]